MANEPSADDSVDSCFRSNFAGWLRSPRDHAPFFIDALVVLDANVLLSLYRITPQTRHELTSILEAISDRLWIPHQAALEFSRNRAAIVIDRNSQFTEMHRLLTRAPATAAAQLEGAIRSLEKFRKVNVTSRSWNPAEYDIDPSALREKLSALMVPAVAELDQLKAEHDLNARDVRSPEADPVLSKIEGFVGEHVGGPYPPERLRELVAEAIEFRYPNKIPPGYADKNKPTALLAAGDYILWRQTIDHVRESANRSRGVLFITADVKPDWHELDDKGQPIGARPELVQELREMAQADLLLLTILEFLEGARIHLHGSVSTQTVEEVRTIVEESAESSPYELSEPHLAPYAIRSFIKIYFESQGYYVEQTRFLMRDTDDGLIVREKGTDRRMLVFIYQGRKPAGTVAIREARDEMTQWDATGAAIIAPAGFTVAAYARAQRAGVQLIDMALSFSDSGRQGSIDLPSFPEQDSQSNGTVET